MTSHSPAASTASLLTVEQEAAAEQWIHEQVPSLVPPLSFRHISGGHSNITMSVTDSRGVKAVLRRPPEGPLPKGAHDVVREAHTVATLAAAGIPVAAVLGVCHRRSVIGAPFTLSAWVDGEVVASPDDAERVFASTATRELAAKEVVDALAALHLLDPVPALGPQRMSEQTYLERQLRRMSEVWEAVRTRDLPVVEELHERLCAARPPERHVGVVHGDYRLGNCMLSPPGRLLAILDWELTTVGDVLADVGFLLNNWESPALAKTSLWMQVPPTQAGGFPSREQVATWYGEKTSFDLRCLDYYQAFGWWRMAVIGEGIKRRYEASRMGQAQTSRPDLGQRVQLMAVEADSYLRQFGN
jgi:aminoglycoside phosphotransferase (APT) family kinase protein